MSQEENPEKLIKVALVTPVHNRRDITLQGLKSVSRIDRTGLDVTVYVVDDGSTDGTSEAIREQFPDVRILTGDGTLWYSEGTNVGIRAALEEGSPDYVLGMNDDAVFDSMFLRRLVETAEKYPRSVVGSLLLLWDEPHKVFQVAPVWSTLKGGWQHWKTQTVWTVPDKPWEVDLIVGNCVLFPASAFRECGYMDAKHYPTFGDAEYTARLRHHGYKLIIDPRSRIFCQPNYPIKRLRHRGLRELFNDLLVDRYNAGSLRRLYHSNFYSAPTKAAGAISSIGHLFHMGLNFMLPNRSSLIKPEKPLSEVFEDRVLNG